MRRLLVFLLVLTAPLTFAQKIWTAAQANEWSKKQPWFVGCNFIPSTASNELEMWQKETWDPKTIDRELGWAEGLGFNVIRVYLHNLVWENDRSDFLLRIGEFLKIADRHKIKVIFVLFDDCWNANPTAGPQQDPVEGVHNSRWVRAPGPAIVGNPAKWGAMELYAKDILMQFKNDKRIIMWDLYNEPGNEGMTDITYPFLQEVFKWAWAIRPTQPLTSAPWNHEEKFQRYNTFQLASSDVITFHNYNDAANLEAEIQELKKLGRPIICSEYMARTNKSTFIDNLPVLKNHRVGAINWGLVSGRSNTIFPWGSKPGTPEPTVWFHDIFRKDGTPFDEKEVAFIKETIKPSQPVKKTN